MTSPLLGSLAKTMAKALGPIFLDATYEIDTPGDGPAYDPGPPATKTYPCKAIEDDWGAYYRQGGLVSGDDRKILVLAKTLAVEPQEGGRFTIRGRTFVVYSNGEGQPAVASDPALAAWECRARA